MANSAENVDSSFDESYDACNDESKGEVEDHDVIMSPIITQDDESSKTCVLINLEPSEKHYTSIEMKCLLSVTCYEAIIKKDMKKDDIKME